MLTSRFPPPSTGLQRCFLCRVAHPLGHCGCRRGAYMRRARRLLPSKQGKLVKLNHEQLSYLISHSVKLRSVNIPMNLWTIR